MKKKFLLISLMVVMIACLFAISVSARVDYREEQTYNYYDTEGNLLYSATTIYAYDNNSSGQYRYEVIIRESGPGFAKFDENGTPLTWYVVSDDKLDDLIGGDSLDQDGVQNITVTSIATLDEKIATVDGNKTYTYKADTDGVYFSKKVVSANFFTTGIKSFNGSNDVYKYKVIEANVKPNGNTSEYCKMTDNGYLLCLYLPETLTGFPGDFCKRTPLRVLEFENNKISCSSLSNTAFTFCANLKSITIPEGITEIAEKTFRECISLSYIKLSNTVTKVNNSAFWRNSAIETFIMGKNVTFCGYLNDEIGRFTVGEKADCVQMKYIYVSPSLNTKGQFDMYRGGVNSKALVGDLKNVIYMFTGSLDEAIAISAYSDNYFKATVNETIAVNNGMTYNEPIDYATYIANKEYYDTQITHHLLVYNVPECVAYYDGQHIFEERDTYKDVVTPFAIGDFCTREGCNTSNVTDYAPILTFLGFSAQIGGDNVCFGYKTDATSLALHPEVSYGVLAVAPGNADMSTFEPLNPDLTSNLEDKKVLTLSVDKEYAEFQLIIKGFSKDSAYYETDIVMCAFVTDGENVDYLCLNETFDVVQQEYASSLNFKYITEEVLATRYNVGFASGDEAMGSLEGTLSQVVKEGEKATTVTAVPNEGYEFATWSDGTTSATIEYAPKENTDLVAYFTPKSTGLPVITINTEYGEAITTLDYYINCEITLLDNTGKGSSIGGQTAEIKGRGNSTWERFDKKPYKFKFEEKQDLFGYGSEKTWVLLADARDYSLLRNMLALNAGLSMSELGFTSKGQSVELYLNGEYRGVYYLCEQIQVKKNRVNITAEDKGADLDGDGKVDPDSIGYLVEMDAWAADGSNQNLPNYTLDGDVFVTITGGQRPFVIKDPEDVFFDEDGNFSAENAAPYLAYIQDYLQQCHNAITNGTKSAENYAKLCELIDVKSFAQAYIIFDLFKNPDTQYSSVYYYKDANGKLVAAPIWDFDMAIGNVTHKGSSGTNAVNFRQTDYLWTASQNTWYKGLLGYAEFKAVVGQELADNADNIRASIAADIAYAREHKEAYEKNFTVWNVIGNTSATEKMGAWSVPTEFKQFQYWDGSEDVNDEYLVTVSDGRDTTTDDVSVSGHLEYIEWYLEESLTNLMASYPAPVEETPEVTE